MSSPTWTPAALSSEIRAFDGTCWRLVEVQHQVSTQKLVDSLGEQELLERLIEDHKPPVPEECRHLHYLLFTPFRYDPPYPKGSRFRRAGRTLGVYYAAEAPGTAIAETAFYRLLFFAESPETPWPSDAAAYTAFSVAVASQTAIDLTRPKLADDRLLWTDPTNYVPCQDLAEIARDADVDVIRYQSVRDPARRANLAILRCRAFVSTAPVEQQTWHLRIGPFGVQAVTMFPSLRLEFGPEYFAADPRMSTMNWAR